MTKLAYIAAIVGGFAITGCANNPHAGNPSRGSMVPQVASPILETSYNEDATSGDGLVHPQALRAEVEVISSPLATPQGPLTIEALEATALANNPAISEAAAQVRALQGKWLQVGLPPNPTGGYTASEIGDSNTAGQQGGYMGQTFVTAHKLERNRAVVAAEVSRAEQELAATERRVRTDVRGAFYLAIVAQRRVELAERLLEIATDGVKASQALVDAEELSAVGLLQTEVRQQNSRVQLQTAHNAREQAWRKLSAVTGGPELDIQPLEGDVTTLPALLDWQSELARLQADSPEVAAAVAEVQRARRSLDRASVQAVPNVSTQASVQYDNSTDFTIAGVQVGMPLPIWNRNQGGIQQSRAQITAAERDVERVQRNLTNRLAVAFRQYADAHVTASKYAEDILPRSQQTLDLVGQAFEHGEVGYLDLLAAQQTYSQTNLDYLNALEQAWQSYVLIDGLLLDGSLDNGATQ
ncbi:TolC family protein [Aeoliella sp. SH292]|uniref:TolC family protein n=1 Tax=Aeoliella sp. SH292 TaxID=3454464 RepID=UPI003F97C84A